jgi:hypothetical protein
MNNSSILHMNHKKKKSDIKIIRTLYRNYVELLCKREASPVTTKRDTTKFDLRVDHRVVGMPCGGGHAS